MSHYIEHLLVKTSGQRGRYIERNTVKHYSFHGKIFYMVCFVLLIIFACVVCIFLWKEGARAEGRCEGMGEVGLGSMV